MSTTTTQHCNVTQTILFAPTFFIFLIFVTAVRTSPHCCSMLSISVKQDFYGCLETNVITVYHLWS